MHDVKNTCNYKDLPLRGTHWYIKYLTKKIYNDYNNVVLSWNFFSSCQGSMWTFSKHYSKFKTVSLKFRKTLQERRLPILKFWQDNPQNNFLNFFTSKNIFITLQIFWGYPWNILEIDIHGMFLKYSGNITSWLLEFVKRSTFVTIKSHAFNTKTTFPSRTFKKSFPLKCSLNVPEHYNAEGTLIEYSRNIACWLEWDLKTLGVIQKEKSMHEHFIKSIQLNKEGRY